MLSLLTLQHADRPSWVFDDEKVCYAFVGPRERNYYHCVLVILGDSVLRDMC